MKKRWLLGILCAFFIMTGFHVDAKATMKVQSLTVTTKSKGAFNPTKDKYVTFKIKTLASQKNSFVRVRVLNSKGKYIYQKTIKNKTKKSSITMNWNGKAIKNNTAKVKANTYIADGSYRVEAYAYYKVGKKSIAEKKKVGFKVSRKASTQIKPPTSTPVATTQKKPVATTEAKKPTQQETIVTKSNAPIYTGDAGADYLAERMVQAAGVKSTMTQDQKVKAIYHWMNYHVYHVHHNEPFRTRYYNLSKLQSEVASYQKKTASEVSKGNATYSKYSFRNMHQQMEYRCGECGDTSAIFKILCNHVGVKAGICSGYYLNRNGTKAGHYWNYAVVDGKTYYYDIDVEIQNVGKAPAYYWYKETRAESEKRHEYK